MQNCASHYTLSLHEVCIPVFDKMKKKKKSKSHITAGNVNSYSFAKRQINDMYKKV